MDTGTSSLWIFKLKRTKNFNYISVLTYVFMYLNI